MTVEAIEQWKRKLAEVIPGSDIEVHAPPDEAGIRQYSHMLGVVGMTKALWEKNWIPPCVSVDFAHTTGAGGVIGAVTAKALGCKLVVLAFGHFQCNENGAAWKALMSYAGRHYPKLQDSTTVVKTDGFSGVPELLKELGQAVHARCVLHLAEATRKNLGGKCVRKLLSLASKKHTVDGFIKTMRKAWKVSSDDI